MSELTKTVVLTGQGDHQSELVAAIFRISSPIAGLAGVQVPKRLSTGWSIAY
jgi:hypothetical protein